MADMGKTEVDVTVEEVVSELIQAELIERAVLRNTVQDFSSRVRPGMDKLKIPRGGSLAAEDKAENTALTSQVITYVADDLDLDQHKAILVRIEDRATLQAKPDVMRDVIARMGTELALEEDQYLITKLEAASAAAPDHRVAYAGASIAQTDILEGKKLLEESFAPRGSRWLAISPESEKAMLSIGDFVQADTYGNPMGLVNGELGRIYGFRVVVSTVVETLKTIAYASECCAFARQKQVSFESDRDLENVATVMLASSLFGAKELQAGQWQVMLGTAV